MNAKSTSRWTALTLIFLSFLQFTLNWFCIIPSFGAIAKDLHLSFTQVGGIVGVFVLGYGVAHVPAGWIAQRFGMRNAMLLGIACETLGAAMSAWAPSYEVLLAGRLVAGVGGAIYFGSALGLTAAWFREHELATANGLVGGVAFTVGAVIGLFAWGPIAEALGWRGALLLGAGIGVATLVMVFLLFPTPPGDAGEMSGEHLDVASLRRIFGSPLLWIMGIAYIGAYGSYFTAAQLLPAYAEKVLHVAPQSAETVSVILLLSGIPGSFVGGWLSDKVLGVLPTFMLACAIEAIALIMIPYVGQTGLEVAAALIGGFGIAGFVGWVTIPGQRSDAFHLSDVPTAIGLLLTMAAIGGAGIPPLFSKIASSWSFEVGWVFTGVITLLFTALALLSRRAHARGAVLAGSAQ